MEQIYGGKPIFCEGLPSSTDLSTLTNYPWFFAHNLEDNGTVNFYTTIDDEQVNYRCRIPELLQLGGEGIRIYGFDHGWAILSNRPHNVMWSLWNPVTSKLIRLPPLEGSAGRDFGFCCLSSHPGDPSAILLLTSRKKPNFVFCRLKRRKRSNRSRWTEMSYAKQLKRLMGGREEDGMLDSLTCCNGKVYALSYDTESLLQIDIEVVKDKEVVITMLPFQKLPILYLDTSFSLPDFYVLKGTSTAELFLITGRFNAPAAFYLFKLDMTTHDTTSTWEEVHDLKDAVLFVDLLQDLQISYIPAVASGFGGYVHFRNQCITINSFHVKDKTLLLSPMRFLLKAVPVSLWEYRGLEAGNDKEVKCTDDYIQEENNDHIIPMRSSDTEDDESRLLDIPFHVLEMLMELCVGIEYLNFRATCKRCRLAAPSIHWRNKTELMRLQKYSLASPWLMVVEDNGGIMKFTDPVSGEKYLMKSRSPLNYDELNSLSCSKYGWLLHYTCSSIVEFQLVFFNPFTNDVRKLPPTPPYILENFCFSAPPTSTNCTVVGFSTQGNVAYILRNVGGHEQMLWHRFDVDYGGVFCFPTFRGRDLYALCNEGQLVVFKDMSEGRFSQPEVVAGKPPERPGLFDPPRYFLMKCDEDLLLVNLGGKFGGVPLLFKFDDLTKEWKQIESLEMHVIFIGGSTCVCIKAKTPKMQNKVYFPQLKDGKLFFYSLETSEYRTIDGKLATLDEVYGCCGTVHLSLHAWIEPTWYQPPIS